MTGGTLTSTAAMTVSGLTTLSNGTISGSGAVNANGGILFNVSNATFTLDGRTLTNPAGQTATWTGINSTIRTFRRSARSLTTSACSKINALRGTEAHVNRRGRCAASFNDDGSFIKSASSSQGTSPAGSLVQRNQRVTRRADRNT